MSLIAFCETMGGQIDAVYARHNYNLSDFPNIAADALRKHDPSKRFTASDVIDAAVSAELPWQADVDSSFGQPAVTLFHRPRFRIDALCWRSSTTSIHQHEFAGAFAILAGSSLQTTYSFEPKRRVTETFVIGELRTLQSTVLQRGHIEPIEKGDSFIHSVFHLDHPSVTLVVRSHGATPLGVQFRYERPNLAYYPFERDYQTSKRLQATEYLCDVKPIGYIQTISRLIQESPAPTAFAVLRKVLECRIEPIAWARLLDQAVERHGDDISALTTVLLTYQRERELVKLRGAVKDEDLRFMLALLLNLRAAPLVVEAVATRVGTTDALNQSADWICALERVSSGVPLSGVERTVLTLELGKVQGAIQTDELGRWPAREVRAAYARLAESFVVGPIIRA